MLFTQISLYLRGLLHCHWIRHKILLGINWWKAWPYLRIWLRRWLLWIMMNFAFLLCLWTTLCIIFLRLWRHKWSHLLLIVCIHLWWHELIWLWHWWSLSELIHGVVILIRRRVSELRVIYWILIHQSLHSSLIGHLNDILPIIWNQSHQQTLQLCFIHLLNVFHVWNETLSHHIVSLMHGISWLIISLTTMSIVLTPRWIALLVLLLRLLGGGWGVLGVGCKLCLLLVYKPLVLVTRWHIWSLL